MKVRKNKISAQKKIKILNYVSFSLLIIITTGISVFSGYYNQTMSDINTNIETQWRDEARNKAKYLSQQLELSISKQHVNYWNDMELHEWAEEEILPMKVGGELSNIILVNIGYSIRNWDDINWLTAKDELKLNISDEHDIILSNHFKNMDFIGYSNSWVKDYIDAYIKDFSDTYSEDYDSIVTAVQKVLFVKNKIIMDTDPSSIINNKLINTRFLEDYLYTDKHNFQTNLQKILSGQESIHYDNSILKTANSVKWLEWCVVPPNKLGWDLQSPHKEGIDNVAYKKMAIIVELDKNEIYRPYNIVFSSVKNINNICKITASIIMVLVILILFISFYKFLHTENK